MSGTSGHGDVKWHTYFRDEDQGSVVSTFDPKMFAATLVAHGLVGRTIAERENPYLPRTTKVSANGKGVSVLPNGAASVRQADDGGLVLADLGVLTASEAARVADAVNSSGAGEVTAVSIGVM